MKVIVGSSDLWPTPNLASKVLSIMVSIDDEFIVRCAYDLTIASGTEELAVKISKLVGRTVNFSVAEKYNSSAGFKRDIAMVRAASGVYAFFGPEGPVEGGTAHVVSCALRQGIEVTAFGLDRDGSIIEIGYDGGSFYETPYFHARTFGLPNEGIEWRK